MTSARTTFPSDVCRIALRPALVCHSLVSCTFDSIYFLLARGGHCFARLLSPQLVSLSFLRVHASCLVHSDDRRTSSSPSFKVMHHALHIVHPPWQCTPWLLPSEVCFMLHELSGTSSPGGSTHGAQPFRRLRHASSWQPISFRVTGRSDLVVAAPEVMHHASISYPYLSLHGRPRCPEVMHHASSVTYS